MDHRIGRRRKRGAVAVALQEGKFLVIQRSANVSAPGAYCFPGGGIEAGESESEALCREMQEELAVVVTPLQRVWHSVTSWGVELFWWQVTLPTPVELVANPDEVGAVFWYSPAEMLRLPALLDSNRDFLAALERGEIALQKPTP